MTSNGGFTVCLGENDLGLFAFQVCDKQYKLEGNAVDVLNLLGNHNFRIIESTSTTDQKIVWTLELREFWN